MVRSASMAAVFLGLGGLAAASCSKDSAQNPSDGGAPPGMKLFCDLPASCQQIAQVCMPKDEGTPGPVHDCHLTGMERGVLAECDKDLQKCLSTCNAAPALGDGPVEDLTALCRDGGVPDAGPATFPVSPLSTFMSDGQDLRIELRTSPTQPIQVGPDGRGQLVISDASSGAPVDGLHIIVTTWMPVMGHSCSPVAVSVEPQGAGVYVLTPFLASMKGACEVKLEFSGSKTEHAVSPTFDITQ